MGAFFILRTSPGNTHEDARDRLAAQFAAQGFAPPRTVTVGDWHVAVYAKRGDSRPNLHVIDSENFAFSTGTLLYRRKLGTAALDELHATFDGERPDLSDLRGTFALGICKGGRLFLLSDRLGVYKIYRDEGWTVASSSFLAALASVTSPAVDAQGVYEYVFQEATYGGKTIVEQIRLLDHRKLAEFGPKIDLRPLPPVLAASGGGATQDAHLECNLALLRRWFGDIVACFGARIDTALSGGYDSRLILALLRVHGVAPRLHVYGRETDDDVRIARAIAEGEGLELTRIDKARFPLPEPDAFGEVVARNCLAMDGWPADGIFDSGADVATRAERMAGGAVALNGGGGEIYRNFFYLPDRNFTAEELVWTFYSQFDPSACTAEFRESDYTAAMAAAIRETLGRPGNTLSRRDIEYLYPAFRCGYWMGKNNSVNNRFGFSLTPFIEPELVAAALDIPLALKNHGRFEAALIRALAPALARYPSSYGHDFAGDVPLKRRLKDHLTMMRPPRLRRYAFRLKSRLGAPVRPALLSEPYLSRAIDTSFPLMSDFFDIARVRDNGQFARICTLEYLLTRR